MKKLTDKQLLDVMGTMIFTEKTDDGILEIRFTNSCLCTPTNKRTKRIFKQFTERLRAGGEREHKRIRG